MSSNYVYFTTNPADIEKLPGLYVVEKDPPGFIEGADLNTVAIASKTVRGPTGWHDVTPASFESVFGGRDYVAGGAAISEGWKALLNKGFGRIKFRRVVASDAAAATANLEDVVPTTIAVATANGAGVWANAGNGLTYSIEDASDGDSNHWNLRVNYRGDEVLYENLNTTAGNDNLATVVGDDPSRFITLTKSADGRPINAANQTLSTGSDGTLADSDYTAAITEMASVSDVAIGFVPEAAVSDQAVLNGAFVTQAPNVADRVFPVWSGVHSSTEAPAANVTAVGTQITTRSDRIIWCYNSTKTTDPVTALKFDQAPHVWMASILAQTEPGQHPGDGDTKQYLAGVKELHREELSRADLISLRDAGVSTLEKVKGGFQFRDAVTTDLTTGKTEVTRRRMADFITLSISDFLADKVKKKGTRVRRQAMVADIEDFLTRYTEDEAGDAALVDTNEDGSPAYQVLNNEVNTKSSRGRGVEKILTRVDLIDHMLYLVLETEIGSGVTIEASN